MEKVTTVLNLNCSDTSKNAGCSEGACAATALSCVSGEPVELAHKATSSIAAAKAAGGHSRYTPGRWKENDGTQDLVEELVAENPATKSIYIRKGRGVTGTCGVIDIPVRVSINIL